MADVLKKKFINQPANAVSDAIKGLVSSDSAVSYHPHNPRVIVRSDADQLKSSGVVTLVAGGGSGHEPFAAGYVGRNGLTGAVCGDIFASPPSTHVSDAVELVNGSGGTLVYVINYTGDRLHFGMAAERLKANRGSKVQIDLIYVDDDVALEAKMGGAVTTGRRGLAGAAITLQIAGVMAEHAKASYEVVRATSRKVIENLGTFGASLYACALPGKSLMFQLGDDEMELGLGIHGETGLERRKLLGAREFVAVALTNLVKSKRLEPMQKGQKVAVLLNNLGGVSQLELGILQGEAVEWLNSNGFMVERFITGAVMTSIDGYGVSFTVLKVQAPKWVEYLDVPSAVSRNWKISKPRTSVTVPTPRPMTSALEVSNNGVQLGSATTDLFQRCLLKACEVVGNNEDVLNRLDAACGDGDCGSSLKAAAKAIEKACADGKLKLTHPKLALLQLSHLFEDSIGGTSGALYALLLGAASKCFEKSATSDDWKNGLQNGLEAIMYYGHAKPGYRTLVDPLSAAVNVRSSDWHQIVETIEKSARDTAKLEARSGRASYTSAAQQNQPDPGAHAVALWARAIHDEFYKK